jgi:site-specific DNA recombinase
MSHSSPERAALYARVSTDAQAEEGLSIAAQLAEMREFAEKKGWSVVAEYIDPGITGRTLDRPGLRDLLAAAEEHTFDIVVVHELSRLSRSIFDTFAFFEALGRFTVGFVSVKEPQFDLSTPTGRLLLIFIAGINQYYIDVLRLHTKKSKRQRARQGLYNASIAPYGYQHTGDARTPPIVVEEEARAVRMAFEHYATGRYSFQRIADLLNDSGFRTRRRRRFSKDTVTDMIRNRFYTGKVVYREGHRGSTGEICDGLHEPIISEELWEATFRVRKRHHHASRGLQRKVRPYLLSRIAHCHICGRKLRAQSSGSGGRHKYYREMSYARGYDDCPNSQIGVRANRLHEQIGAIVRRLHLPPDWQEELAQIIGEDDETAILQNRRARLIASRRRLKEAYIHGDFEEDEDIYRRELEAIRRELDQIPTEDDLLQIRQAAEILVSLGEVWDEANPAEQCDLVQLMLRDVQVDVAQGRVLFLRTTAPFIPLFRAIPLLQERDLGSFTPVWPDEMADVLPHSGLPPLTSLPEETADLPFLPTWPWVPDSSARISPPLSAALKARRRAGYTGGLAISVSHPGVPSVILDARKWPDVSLGVKSLRQVLKQAKGSAAFISTPLAVQSHPNPDELAQAIFRALDDEGYWHLVDLVPASMPAHWVFSFFPEAWPGVQGLFWTAYNFYNTLRQSGFQVEQREHTFRQPVTLGVALEIARGRPGVLMKMADEPYQERMQQLETIVGERGEETLVQSEVTVVEIMAVKRKDENSRGTEKGN